jgi:hypothetical protein
VKRQLNCETNKAHNRETEKVKFLKASFPYVLSPHSFLYTPLSDSPYSFQFYYESGMDVFLQLYYETKKISIKELAIITESHCGSNSSRGTKY